MNEKYQVSVSPHVRDSISTQKIMLFVIIALLPASIVGVLNFGPYALLILCLSVASSVAAEYCYERILKKPVTTGDLSAVVTGLLIGMNMPPQIPWWIPVIGSVFAIIVVKQVFGGLGQNFMNPALGARCFLLLSFAQPMTSFTYDGVTGATPLASLKAGESVDPVKMLLGTEAGTIGETSVIALLVGAIILLIMGIINLRIPATYIITFAVFILLFGGHGFDITFLIEELCGGGLILGAFFMATDYVTSPITPNGQILYGICLGVLTGLIRIFGSSAEGVSYAIIISNLLVPLIERVTVPRAFGIVPEKKGGSQ